MHQFVRIGESIIRVFLATTNPSLPQSFRVRLILGLWFLGCIILNAHVQTNFIASLTKPGYNTEISTIHDLLESNLQISYADAYADLVERLNFGKELRRIGVSKRTTDGFFQAAMKKVCFWTAIFVRI